MRRERRGRGLGRLPALACALAAVVVLAACGSAPAAHPGGAANTGSVPVSMFGALPTNVKNMSTDWATRYAERTFGLNINWDLVPAGTTLGQKETLELASGNYPDVIWDGTFSQTDVMKFGHDGVLIPLNSLLKEYAPHIWNAIQTTPGLKQAVTAPDGKIYALPHYNYDAQVAWPFTIWISLQDLSRYGLSLPRTTAQFARVLSVFRAHGLVPVTSDGGWGGDMVTPLMNGFIPYNGGGAYLDVVKGKVMFAPTQPQWKQGLEYIYSLFRAGDFTKADLTQNVTEFDKLLSQNQVGTFMSGGSQVALPNYGEPGSQSQTWYPMLPLKGPKGVQSAAFANPVAGFMFGITNHASRQAAIRVLKLLDFQYTPQGVETMQFGQKGVNWTDASKGTKGGNGQQAIFNTNWNSVFAPGVVQNEGWGQWGPMFLSERWRNDQAQGDAFAAASSETMSTLSPELSGAGHQAAEQYPSVWVPPSKSETYAADATNIESYVAQWTDEFITGEKSITGDWSSYVAGLDSLGLASYVQTSQQLMRSPVRTDVPEYERNVSAAEDLLKLGPVPALWKRYLPQSGITVGSSS